MPATGHFVEKHRFRPVELVAARFVAVDGVDASHTVRDDGTRLTGKTPVAPFASVQIRFRRGSEPLVHAGLAAPSGDHLLATYRTATGRVTLEQRLAGRVRTLAVTTPGESGVDGLGFVLCENQATALIHRSDRWQPVLTARRNVAAFADYRDPAVLEQLQYAYGVFTENFSSPSPLRSGPGGGLLQRLRRPASRAAAAVPAGADAEPGDLAVLTSVQAGLFGRVGVRDPHIVQRPDGTPYVRDGRLYLTLTCAGLGFFQQAHWGVFTLDLSDLTRLEQVAQIYFRRDGRLLGDHAGQLVVDEDRQHVVVSSWGDFSPGSILARYAISAADLLSGSHVLETQPLPLPTPAGCWDPGLTRIEDRWYVPYVASPTQEGTFVFHPGLAASAPGDSYESGLAIIGEDSGLHQCEGPILALVGDDMVSTRSTGGDSTGSTSGDSTGARWRLLTSDGSAREFPVYDLGMRRIGTLNAPYDTNIPHPQVVTVPGPRGPRRLLITFDGTPFGESVVGYGTHGDLVIYEAEPLEPPRCGRPGQAESAPPRSPHIPRPDADRV